MGWQRITGTSPKILKNKDDVTGLANSFSHGVSVIMNSLLNLKEKQAKISKNRVLTRTFPAEGPGALTTRFTQP